MGAAPSVRANKDTFTAKQSVQLMLHGLFCCVAIDQDCRFLRR